MRIDGIQLNEGSSISHLTVASGTAFPANPNEAEVFFRTDANLSIRGLYCHIGGTWDRVASADSLTVPTGVSLPTQQLEGDLFYQNTNDASEGLYVYNGTAWVLVSAGGVSFTITGDVSGTIDGGTDVLTLATVISPATFGSASSSAVLTVDAKGRVTSAFTTGIILNTSQVSTGTFADARISASSVTQHQGSLTILETQITDGALLARVASSEAISGTWTFSTSPVLNNSTFLSSKNSSGFTTQVLGINASNQIQLGSLDVAVNDLLFMNGVEQMRLYSSGLLKIGPGTASPSRHIMVNTASGAPAGIQLFQDGNESWIIETKPSTPTLSFTASGTERMSLTNGGDLQVFGNIGIGMTPVYKLDVTSAVTGSKLFRFSATGGTSLFGYSDGSGSGITNSDPYQSGAMVYMTGTDTIIHSGATARLTVNAAGITVTGVMTETSTIKIKENVRDLVGALESVLALRGVMFDVKVGGPRDQIGLIAEEVYEVLPTLVTLDPAGEIIGVQYQRLTAVLIEALKTQEQRLTDQEARLALLEAKLTMLEAA